MHRLGLSLDSGLQYRAVISQSVLKIAPAPNVQQGITNEIYGIIFLKYKNLEAIFCSRGAAFEIASIVLQNLLLLFGFERDVAAAAQSITTVLT